MDESRVEWVNMRTVLHAIHTKYGTAIILHKHDTDDKMTVRTKYYLIETYNTGYVYLINCRSKHTYKFYLDDDICSDLYDQNNGEHLRSVNILTLI